MENGFGSMLSKRSRARATSYIPNFVFGLAVIARIAMAADEAPTYSGPGSCASPACHGGVTERHVPKTSSIYNEYSTWAVRDKHAQAYTVLTNDLGKRMVKILEISHPGIDPKPKCLVCHALNVPESQRARTFDITDGVSCENCHGPSSPWLKQHFERDWTYEKSVNDKKMYPTRDPVKRSELCLSCHLGTPENFVDHELIAAGHPDLYFEIDSFTSHMPAHWDKEAPEFHVRTLAVGQAVQLRKQLERVAHEAKVGVWPEYAELECFSCHHRLTDAKDSWRQERGYTGRRPGNPPFNLARLVVFRRIIQEVDAAGAQQLKADMDLVSSSVAASATASATDLGSDRGKVGSRANTAAATAQRIAETLAKKTFDRDMMLRLLKTISGDADSIAAEGERTAEQATMVLASLFDAANKPANPVSNEERIKAVIHTLFELVKDPSAFNGPRFAAEMKTLHGLLP